MVLNKCCVLSPFDDQGATRFVCVLSLSLLSQEPLQSKLMTSLEDRP